jgi:peptide/nickel transport system permease protein
MSEKRRILLYLGKRVIVYVITLFISFSVVFLFLRLIPGDPITRFVRMLEQRYSYSMEMLDVVEKWKAKLGLEGDIFTQYSRYIQNVFLRLDFGPSFLAFPTPVQDLILTRLPWTIALLGLATLISWTIGTLAGTLLGWKRGTKVDSVLFTVALCMSQVPYYIAATLLVLLLAYIFPVFPSRYAFSPGVQIKFSLEFISSVLYHSFLPALSMVLTSAFGWLISARFLTITILGEDYLLFAQAKGLKATRVLNRYILRNTLLPQATGLAMSLGFIVNGAYLVEWIFSYPGIGGLLQYAILLVDYNTIQGIILMSIFTVLTANLIMDLVYPLIDPRIKTRGK